MGNISIWFNKEEEKKIRIKAKEDNRPLSNYIKKQVLKEEKNGKKR